MGSLQDDLRSNLRSVNLLARAVDLIQLNVKSNEHVLALNNHDTPVFCAMDCTSQPDIREICDRNYVQDTPDEFSLLAFYMEAELPSSPVMGSITSNHVLDANDFSSPFFPPALSYQLVSIIFGKTTPEQAI